MNQQQFETIYHLLYGTAGFLSLMFASIQDVKRRYFYKAGTFLSFVLVFLFAILFGSRGNEVGTDTEMYIWQYENYQLFPINIDFIYSYLLIFLNWLDIGTHGFLLVISCFYLFILGWAISVFSKKIRLNLLFIFFAFISFFFFKSLGINIIRQGVALSFFLLGVSYFFKLDKINGQAVLAFILAVGFHYTILVAALLFVFAIISKKIRIEYFITFYVTCLILALLNFGIKDFASVFSFLLIDERRNTYLEDYGSDNYEIGFKPQFVAFNSIF